MARFKDHILNEEKSFLGNRVGDVLTALQDLQNDMENLGSRLLMRYTDQIVNQMRKILHDRWKSKHEAYLKELQKVAVALKKAIEEKGDVKQMIPAAVEALQNLSGKLGVKVNNMEAPELPGAPATQQDFQLTGGNAPTAAPPAPPGAPGQVSAA